MVREIIDHLITDCVNGMTKRMSNLERFASVGYSGWLVATTHPVLGPTNITIM